MEKKTREIEQELLELARQFDKAALAEIFDMYSPELYKYAVRLLDNPMQAEECVSETFSRFLNVIHRGGGPEKHLRAYLYRIAHNWITDIFRQQPVLPLESETLFSSGGELAQQVEERIARQRIADALKLLTPDQRQVIVLKYVEGWNNREIAETLGKNVGAVKSLQNRALTGLRRLLAHKGEASE